jgi:hypothetical protein
MKSKDWLDNTFWPGMGVLALTPAYFAIRATAHHITYRTCTYEKHPLMLEAYGYMSYAVISVTYVCLLALLLGGAFKAFQGISRWRKRTRAESVKRRASAATDTKSLQTLLQPIQGRAPDLDIRVRPYSISFLLLHCLVKFLRFWPALLLTALVNPVFVAVVCVIAGFGGGAGAAYWLKEELCLPALPLWIAGLTCVGVGIFFANGLGNWLSNKENGKILSQRVWERIMTTPEPVRKRLASSRCNSNRYFFEGKVVRGIDNDSGSRMFKRNDNGCTFRTSAKNSCMFTFTHVFETRKRTLHMYVVQGKAKTVVKYVRIRFPRRETSDIAAEVIALNLVSEFSPLSLLLRTATAVSKGGQA